MEIIPVIDLKGGVVVRARHGDRASYRPIETPLSPTSEAVDVVAGLLVAASVPHASTSPISTRSRGAAITPQFSAIARRPLPAPGALGRQWLRRSRRRPRHSCAARPARVARARVGIAARRELIARAPGRSARDPLARLPRRCTSSARRRCSPTRSSGRTRIIVMTLARVGSGAGPDLERFDSDQRASRRARASISPAACATPAIWPRSKASGAAGMLVASALHDGQLSRRGPCRRLASRSDARRSYRQPESPELSSVAGLDPAIHSVALDGLCTAGRTCCPGQARA